MNTLGTDNQTDTTQSAPALSFEARESIISQYSLFALLDTKDIRELTVVAHEVRRQPGAIITKEGDIVDSVYLIVSGEAKVTREMTSANKTEIMELATLKKGDAIGLTGTGFFARRGVRTATVTALKPMILLAFDVVDFQRILQKTSVASETLKNAGDKILLMNFIHQSNLFKDFSVARIQWLAKNVKKITLQPGEILFKQGDTADEFYFLLTGCMSITIDNDKGRMVRLYDSNSVIGVDTFTAGSKQTSIAKAEAKSELFVIDKKQIEDAKAWEPSYFHDLWTGWMNSLKKFF